MIYLVGGDLNSRVVVAIKGCRKCERKLEVLKNVRQPLNFTRSGSECTIFSFRAVAGDGLLLLGFP